MSTTAAKELLEVRSPVSGLSIEHLGITPASQIPDVVARAREAQPDWEGLGLAARARIFKRAQKWLTDNQARVVETIIAENGKTFEDALLPELWYGIHALGFWAGLFASSSCQRTTTSSSTA